ncbi:hypothetical protein BN135_3314 [Cronobacter muytjensii 530]
MTVVIVLAVVLVVFTVVGHQIVKREAVVRGNKVHARPRPAPALIVEVAGAEQTRGEIGRNVIALPVFAHRIAIFVVPLRPARREAPHLIAAGADIPWLADKLHLREHRILHDGVEKAATLVEALRLAPEDSAEIEAKTVDMHRFRPVTQGIHHHLQHARMRSVHRVAGTGIVDVVTVLIRHGTVVREVVDAFKRERRAKLVPFRGVVVDHIQDHLDTGVMVGAHHIAEPLNAARAEIARGRREKAQRVIAPEVFQALVEQVLIVREPVYRQQFDRSNAEALDVIHRRLVRHAVVGAAQLRRHRRVELRETFHVRLIDHRMWPDDGRPFLILPVELVRIDNAALRHIRRAVALIKRQVFIFMQQIVGKMRLIPLDISGELARVRVNQQFVRVEAVTVFRIVRPVHAIAIQRARLQARHIAMPYFMRVFRQRQPGDFVFAARIVEAELDALCVRRENREVNPLAVIVRAEGITASRRDFKSLTV